MNKRLGKGLDALLPALSINEDDKVVEIPLSQIRANPYQPRKYFNEESISELAASIKEHGVIQPIIVRSVVKGYEIIAGERRFRASQQCGLATIPAVIKKFSDQQTMEIALIENVQREDLNAMEVAVAYQTLMNHFSYTQEELSQKVGKSRSHVANFIRLLQLPEKIKQYVSRGTLSMGHAKAVAGLKDNKLQLQLAEQSIKNEWSVRELEQAIKQQEQTRSRQKPTIKPTKKDPFIQQVEENLRSLYKTSVKVTNQNSKGKIELNYYSKEDLERLIQLLYGKTTS